MPFTHLPLGHACLEHPDPLHLLHLYLRRTSKHVLGFLCLQPDGARGAACGPAACGCVC